MSAPAGVSVTAIMAVYNEADIMGSVLSYLTEQGVSVYLLDHGSTDGTVAEARRFLGKGLIAIERFPEESGFPAEDAQHFAWRHILQRKQELAQRLDSDWLIHCDADEFRESPWIGVSLVDGIHRVDDLGYNAIDFQVLDFCPTHDDFRAGADPRDAFCHYQPSPEWNRVQVRCWKRTAGPLDLVSSAGHEARFPDRRIFPIRFLLRHYPLRSQQQAERKVFRERLPRFDREERAMGWHVQYDNLSPGHRFIRDATELLTYDEARVKTQLQVENRLAEELRQQVQDSETRCSELRSLLAKQEEMKRANQAPSPAQQADESIERVRQDRAARPGGAILFYHRISTVQPDPHGLCVAPDLFRAHLRHLRAQYRPVSLPDLADALGKGELDARAVAVTLDDGFLDALDHALPILSELGIPATFFVSSERLHQEHETWQDLLTRIFLGEELLPTRLALTVDGETVSLATAHPPEREAAFAHVNELCWTRSFEDRSAIVAQIVHWSGRDPAVRRSHRLMTAAEVGQLAQSPLVTIGCHGIHHLCLPTQPAPIRRREVVESRTVLESLLKQSVGGFSYPFGALDDATVSCVRDAGFDFAVTTQAGLVCPGADPWRLARNQVRAGTIESFAKWIDGLFRV